MFVFAYIDPKTHTLVNQMIHMIFPHKTVNVYTSRTIYKLLQLCQNIYRILRTRAHRITRRKVNEWFIFVSVSDPFFKYKDYKVH